MHCLEGGFYMAGLVFISLETVLPSFVKHLGGADQLIAFMPVVLPATFSALGLFIAPLVERMHQFKTFVCIFGALQRLPYLVAGLVMLLVPMSDATLLWVVMLVPLLSGLVGGIAVQAWMEMVTRMIPPNRRASGWAIRYQFSNFIGLGAGVVIHQVLTHSPDARGYAALHLICFGFLVLSFTAQLFMIEPPDPHGLPDDGLLPQHPCAARDRRRRGGQRALRHRADGRLHPRQPLCREMRGPPRWPRRHAHRARALCRPLHRVVVHPELRRIPRRVFRPELRSLH
jgi:MFS family permease